jgi:hypothetical protein
MVTLCAFCQAFVELVETNYHGNEALLRNRLMIKRMVKNQERYRNLGNGLILCGITCHIIL